MSRFPGVFMDANRRSCIAINEGDGYVGVIQMGAKGLTRQSVAVELFGNEWKASEYDVAEAAKRYIAFAQKHAENDALALECVGGALIQASIGAPSFAPELNEKTEFSTQKEQKVSEDFFAEKEHAGADNSPEVVHAEQTGAAAAPVEPVEIAAPVVAAAEDMAAAPVVPVAAPAVGDTQAADDEEQEQAYAVHVNGQSVTVQMGKARESRLSENAYAGRPQTIETAPAEPTFYVALDANGVMVRCATVNPLDRKVIGALVGGWVAEGFVVTKAGLKEMGRYVSAARKAKADT